MNDNIGAARLNRMQELFQGQLRFTFRNDFTQYDSCTEANNLDIYKSCQNVYIYSRNHEASKLLFKSVEKLIFKTANVQMG